MLPGATASTSTTRGRQRAKSMPASTSASAPSTSIFRKSIVVEPGLGDQRRQRPHGLDDGLEAGPELAGAGRMLAHGGGEPVQPVDHMELGLALRAPGEAGDRVVARAHVGVDVGERLLRLDHQAAPAL